MVRAEFVPAMYVMCEEFEGVECGYKDDFESCACVCFEEGKDADLWAPVAWTGDLGQDRFAMLAHQCILDHYFPASTLIRIGFNRSRCCLWCARDVRVKAQPEPKPLDVKKTICS